jgi:soluble lytic murein transglycosylase-like protein
VRAVVVALVVAAVSAPAPPAAAETRWLVDADGTVHVTNVPDDPLYRRLGLVPEASEPDAGLVRGFGARIAPYAAAVVEAARKHDVPVRLVAAIISAESGFDPRAVSPKGARGLMQLMPATARMLGVPDAFHPADNIEAGVRHLRGLLERFDQDLRLALAAYNAGEAAVISHRGIPPYRETRDYVARVMALAGAAPVTPP